MKKSNRIRKGSQVVWKTMFGEFMFGEVLRVRKGVALILRSIGGTCTVSVERL